MQKKSASVAMVTLAIRTSRLKVGRFVIGCTTFYRTLRKATSVRLPPHECSAEARIQLVESAWR
jgi:hypothetical protein